ncbi:MAG: heme exporter protein CcmB, partial [Longimicrobiales bacterium]
MAYLSVVWTVARKDLLVELRTRERFAAMGAFTVLVAVLFNYAIDSAIVRPQVIAPGVLWMTIIFGGMLGIGRTFHLE